VIFSKKKKKRRTRLEIGNGFFSG